MKKTITYSVAAMLLALATNNNAIAQEANSETIIVIGARANMLKIAGSGDIISAKEIEQSRAISVNEALRKVSGVFARDEEGLGLRPNIGIRGLNPTRSTKVLLLEDGLPLAYAPYGDNATYAHPPFRRFSKIEVLKGASQIRFGPNSIGGVVNYVTPSAFYDPGFKALIAGGNRDYQEAFVSGGAEILGFGTLFQADHLEFDGNRENQHLETNDAFVKLEKKVSDNQSLILKAFYSNEDSQISYSGLTQAEFLANPYGNAFKNDNFAIERIGGAAIWNWRISEHLNLKTSAQYVWFDRDWWRQSSNSAQRPNDSSDPACGSMVNLSTTCGSEGRLREYQTWQFEQRLGFDKNFAFFDLRSEIGLRYTNERQRRLQINSDDPFSKTLGVGINGGLKENNFRYADALALFAMADLKFDKFTLTPGVRFEDIDYKRINALNPAAIITGQSDLQKTILGLGALYEITPNLVVYSGVHNGFAPPRVEDIINNGNGQSVDLDAELSTNYELGIRGQLKSGLNFELGYFKIDFENQIIPNSVAGGVGATLTSAGETNHEGFEAAADLSFEKLGFLSGRDLTIKIALTWLEKAEFVGTRFSNISGFSNVSVTGNRLPYAPELMVNFSANYDLTPNLNVNLDYSYTDDQYSDDLNTIEVSANGQRGLIPSFGIWNVALNYAPKNSKFGGYVAVKNLNDELYITDRSRGITVGTPRSVQVGVTVKY